MARDWDTSFEPDVPACMPAAERSIMSGVVAAIGAVLLFALLAVLALLLLVQAFFPPGQIVARAASPDGRHEAVTVEYDHGALGGEVVVRLESRDDARDIAIHGGWGDRPYVKWLDSDTVTVDGHELELGGNEVVHLDE